MDICTHFHCKRKKNKNSSKEKILECLYVRGVNNSVVLCNLTNSRSGVVVKWYFIVFWHFTCYYSKKKITGRYWFTKLLALRISYISLELYNIFFISKFELFGYILELCVKIVTS